MFEGLALDYCPGNDKERNRKKYVDKRWMSRFETLAVAEEAKDIWKKCRDSESRENQKRNIILQAKGYGFFSVWMMVFNDVGEIKSSLIKEFPGTAQECFDSTGNALRRPGGVI